MTTLALLVLIVLLCLVILWAHHHDVDPIDAAEKYVARALRQVERDANTIGQEAADRLGKLRDDIEDMLSHVKPTQADKDRIAAAKKDNKQ